MTYVSHADLGGKPGLGPVVGNSDDQVFHFDWEGRTLALTLAMAATGAFNVDMTRRARETLARYAELTYYATWFEALAVLLVECGLVGEDELAAGNMLHPPQPAMGVLHARDVPAAVAKSRAPERQPTAPARFEVGQSVRMRTTPAPHHSRLPGYARGKVGCIERVRGVHVFADSHAHGLGEDPQWLYSVVFEGRELWGDDVPYAMSVALDAWEPYLEALP
ncbi:Low-molecular weight cobalt-containing nitrile hydratase subunit beta [Paraburkholderia hiiakae]|uniref:Nitrile hydratase subunit beta n=1 Tax=Paraburkholderia hiiakae TaxID=1081782 RepID=A0ABM8P7H4_9BURK|nr:nitrile hydratase subunit beta [Paraburkholderia hiiakae]CAD6558326.1 Low-molecular weight cobalt-containing nitrile hydratase subunit beta [Paraburkholderia hiiakae]